MVATLAIVLKSFLTLLVLLPQGLCSVGFEFLNNSYGTFAAFYGLGINDSDVTTVILTGADAPVKCRNLCLVVQQCKTVSMQSIVNGAIQCNYSKENVYNHFVVPLEKSYMYSDASWYDSNIYLGSDGLFYFRRVNPQGFDLDKKYCETFPNGRMLTLKTREQVQSLTELSPAFSCQIWNIFNPWCMFYLDLKSSTNKGGLEWGDGTPFNSTEAAGIFILPIDASDSYLIHLLLGINLNVIYTPATLSVYQSFNTICQINPLGKP